MVSTDSERHNLSTRPSRRDLLSQSRAEYNNIMPPPTRAQALYTPRYGLCLPNKKRFQILAGLGLVGGISSFWITQTLTRYVQSWYVGGDTVGVLVEQ